MDKATYPRCRTCKWWVEADDWLNDDDEPLGTHRCLIASYGDHVPGGVPDLDHELALAWQEDSNSGRLYTDADFGCIQHEPKEDA